MVVFSIDMYRHKYMCSKHFIKLGHISRGFLVVKHLYIDLSRVCTNGHYRPSSLGIVPRTKERVP